MSIWVCDTEADGLLDQITKFHCLCFKEYNIPNGKFYCFCRLSELPDGFADNYSRQEGVTFFELDRVVGFLNSGMVNGLVAHNIIGYDLPAIKKLLNINYTVSPDTFGGKSIKIVDSLVMSRTLHPDRQLPRGCPTSVKNLSTGRMQKIGPHGLESWGWRCGIKKPIVIDWRSQPLHTYVTRCCEDVKINELTFTALLKECKSVAIPNGKEAGRWDKALQQAHNVYDLMQEQERTGAVFDIEGAEKLLVKIDSEMEEIASKVEPKLGHRDLSNSEQPNFPKKPWVNAFDYNKPWTAGGKLRKATSDYLVSIGITSVEKQEAYIESIQDNIQNSIQKSTTMLSSSAISYCTKFGITELQDVFDEIVRVESGGIPLKLTAPIKLANQDSIKQYLIKELSWIPTLWKTKNLLVDPKTKSNFPPEKQEEKIDKYIKDLQLSPYKFFILEELGYKRDPDYRSAAFRKAVKKKGRGLPSSPQLKDTRGELCPNLFKIDAGMAKLIVRWLSLRNRRTTIKSFDNPTGWLNHPRLKVDGRLPTSSTGITNTTRQRHHIVCNVPSPDDSVIFGKEVRGLFIAPEGQWCVGTDCCGIEGRAMGEAAWNFDGGDYAGEVLNGDVHSKNAAAFSATIGREVGRGEGKGPFYAGIYGCQDAKMAQLLGVPTSVGGDIIEALWSVAPGLKKCKDALERYWEASGKKYIMGINGMKIFTRSKHSLLNAYLQSTDAILMDWSCCEIEREIKKRGLDYKRWIYYHDEVSYYTDIEALESKLYPIDSKPEEFRDGVQYSKPKVYRDGEVMHFAPKDLKETDQWIQWYSEIGEISVQAMKKAGEHFNFRVPLDGQYIVGPSWSTTH